MSRKLPMKIAVYEYACKMERNTFTVQDVIEALQPVYGEEAQLNPKRVSNYLSAFLGIKFLTEEKLELDETGNLVVHYRITDYGKTRIKYIPKH